MKLLVLTWEFPPRIVGGIARHVAELYPELVKLEHEVHLMTVEFGQAPRYEVVDGMKVHRLPVAPGHDFFHWVGNMNESLGRQGGKLILEEGRFDAIHAHDWLVGSSAIALKHHFKIPLVATIHATEHGRHNGIYSDTQRYVHQCEKHLTHEAWRVIVCTDFMRREVERTLNTPWNKIDVVYNGIRREKKYIDPTFDYLAFRRRFAADDEKIVYYVGRMSHEKGVATLIQAAPAILQAMENRVKFVFIGGGQTAHLQQQVNHLGIGEKCYFTGFMPDDELDRFQTIATCAVFPSLYEPFGIVALESFAARVPVVVSNAGGFPEVVRHGQTGIVTWVNDSQSLGQGILDVLKQPDYAQSLVNNAYKDLERRFNWFKLAQQTEAVYGRVLHERSQVEW
ncbi:glycosyltransferase family 4 protein [Myxacorys almedinensis]|uniref:Glycosyltransferase n=1 Tax=Myxacorys almedinensis A TaxID=2690445 RepID=A0A8J8CK33_9CYAN|nr:glycosyltransferase family 4 protein [Myxacorys almedinensis]NDJ16235.1 glycosyltransferase [Myxacorys almedinensis A]